MEQSNRPFPEALADVMENPPKALLDDLQATSDTRGPLFKLDRISMRELHRRCQANGWGAISTIQKLAVGELRPTAEAMEHIAEALMIPPTYFAEYRLAKARQALNEEAVGLKKALANLPDGGSPRRCRP